MGGQIGLEVLVFAGTDWTWFRQEAQIDKRTARTGSGSCGLVVVSGKVYEA